MASYQERLFLHRFSQQLELAPTWLHHEPACALWLDAQRRINSCVIQAYALNTPLKRVAINKLPLFSLKQHGEGWPADSDLSLARPAWGMELMCHQDEIGDFIGWAAAVINRREGHLGRIPTPPRKLLNWDDMGRLDDYLFYLSSISLWSERAFREDIKWGRPKVTAMDNRRALAAAA